MFRSESLPLLEGFKCKAVSFDYLGDEENSWISDKCPTTTPTTTTLDRTGVLHRHYITPPYTTPALYYTDPILHQPYITPAIYY